MELSFFVLAAIAVLAALSVAMAFDTQAGSKFLGYVEPTTWQKYVFVAWTIAGPLYLLGDWYWHVSGIDAAQLPKFQYRQKLISDLWSAGAVMLGVFWGIKKFKE